MVCCRKKVTLHTWGYSSPIARECTVLKGIIIELLFTRSLTYVGGSMEGRKLHSDGDKRDVADFVGIPWR